MKKYFLTVVYAIDDKPETVEAILSQRPWQAVAHTDALADLEHAQADLAATVEGYDAARLEVASLKKTLEAYRQSGVDFAARVHALERTADKLREENAALQQRDDDWHKERSNALVEIARLKAAKADARHDIDDLTARDESQRLRIAELEAQLAAIGAGGVEPLRKRECLHQIQEPAPSEWDVRGHLAESLTCWCRLTGQEAAELVALLQGRPEQADAPVVLPEPDAVLRFERSTAGKENEMPSVVSCNWLPDGEYKLYTEQQVRAMLATGGQAQAGAQAGAQEKLI